MSLPPADRVSAPSRPTRCLVFCAILALLLGVAVVEIVLLAGEHEAKPDHQGTGNYDFAAATCEMVATIPDSIGAHGLSLDRPLVWHLQALALTAIAAGHTDQEKVDYRTKGERLQSALSRTEPEDVLPVIDDLQALCD